MAVTSAVIAATVHWANRRYIVIGGGVCALFGHLLAIVSPNLFSILLSRALTGIGEGAMLSIAYALAAGTHRPLRTYTVLTFAMVATATPMYLSVPIVADHVGQTAVFYILAVMVAICFPFLFGTRPKPIGTHAETTGPEDAGTVWRPFPWILVAILCLYGSNNSLWAFSERIGASIGLSLNTVTMAFLMTVVISLIGPATANWIYVKWSYRPPMWGAVILQVGAIFSLTQAINAGMFFTGLILVNTLSMFLVPFYRGLAAAIDPSGRLGSASVLSQTMATAAGPFIGGLILLLGGGYASLGWMAATLSIASLALSMHAVRRVEATANLQP